jgi:protein-disulfide isomerase
MERARDSRPLRSVRGVLALGALLGSVACGRPGQAGVQNGQIDLTSPGGPAWPTEEASERANGRELSDADVEQLAVRVPRKQVPAVTTQSPSRGPENAKVTLQIFSDFECPFCVQTAPAIAAVERRYPDQLRVVWRNYPLPFHERARPAARAALEAFAQGGNVKFWAMHDWLYGSRADLSDAGLQQAATQLSLDATRVVQAARSAQYDARIDADMAAADAAGIEGTPAVFINDYYLMGARHENEYALVVARALREAR